MVFRTSGGRRATISVLDPLDTLDAETVETAMNTIISKNIFDSNSGELLRQLKPGSRPARLCRYLKTNKTAAPIFKLIGCGLLRRQQIKLRLANKVKVQAGATRLNLLPLHTYNGLNGK